MTTRTHTFPDGFIEQVFAEMRFNIEEILNEGLREPNCGPYLPIVDTAPPTLMRVRVAGAD